MSGQIVIFHQPRFPWNRRGFLRGRYDLTRYMYIMHVSNKASFQRSTWSTFFVICCKKTLWFRTKIVSPNLQHPIPYVQLSSPLPKLKKKSARQEIQQELREDYVTNRWWYIVKQRGGRVPSNFPKELPGPTKIPWNFLSFPDCRASFNSSSPWSGTHN